MQDPLDYLPVGKPVNGNQDLEEDCLQESQEVIDHDSIDDMSFYDDQSDKEGEVDFGFSSPYGCHDLCQMPLEGTGPGDEEGEEDYEREAVSGTPPFQDQDEFIQPLKGARDDLKIEAEGTEKQEEPESEPIIPEAENLSAGSQGANMDSEDMSISPSPMSFSGGQPPEFLDVGPTAPEQEVFNEMKSEPPSQETHDINACFLRLPFNIQSSLSQDAKDKHDKAVHGNKNDTVNLPTNFRTQLKQFLTQLKKIPGEVSRAEKEHIQKFLKSKPSYDSVIEFRTFKPEIANLLSKCNDYFSSAISIHKILKGRAGMKNRLLMIKHYNVNHANLVDQDNIHKWKRLAKLLDQ